MAARALPCCVLALALSCQRASIVAHDQAPPVTQAAGPVVKPGYAELLAQTATRARKAEAVANKNRRSAIALGRAAAEYVALARMSGDYDDYAKAEALLEDAFAAELAIPPYLLRGRLHYSLHRLDRARADLQRHVGLSLHDASGDAAALLLGADLAFAQGNYDAARHGYETTLAMRPSSAAMASLAYYRWRTGEFDEAESLYRRSLTQLGDAAEPRAWTHLQLGLMDLERGRYEEALVHYRDADAELPGFWLIEEHLAEVLTLSGELAAAKTMYVDIIARTDNPEFMDALAGILRDEGDVAGAQQWIARARAIYAGRMAQFPEATAGHALEHHLAFGDATDALALAQRNVALRPNTETRIPLAQAYLAADLPHEAVAVIEVALASPVRTAELHAVAAAAFAAIGDTAREKDQAANARAMNPRIALDYGTD